MLNLRRILLGTLLVLLAPLLYAQESGAGLVAARPRIGLVLSGGGARGAAHVGVLKVLEELRIPIDAIAGTSMGAVVGGLYASGMSAAQIEREMAGVDWQDAFRDRPPRRQLNFRRKQEDREFLVQLPLGFRDGNFQLPSGLIQGQKLSQLLRGLTLPVVDVSHFDSLPTPFRAVATDLETGAAVVLQDGDLATALRASMSAPGIFAPVERDGRLLVDGGVANNLPVDIARAMQVDRLIVVDVGFPLAARDELGSVTNVANQMLTILVRRETQKQLDSLSANDVLVSPSLPTTSSYGFSGLRKIMAAGEQGARASRQALEALALSPEHYEAYLAARLHPQRAVEIRNVAALPGSESFQAPITSLFGNLAGSKLDVPELNRRIDRYYGQGLLESLDFRLQPAGDLEQPDSSDLLFSVRPNSWGPTYVRFGLRLQDDFAGNSNFDAAVRVLFTDLNRLVRSGCGMRSWAGTHVLVLHCICRCRNDDAGSSNLPRGSKYVPCRNFKPADRWANYESGQYASALVWAGRLVNRLNCVSALSAKMAVRVCGWGIFPSRYRTSITTRFSRATALTASITPPSRSVASPPSWSGAGKFPAQH
jgi:NTE family protein